MCCIFLLIQATSEFKLRSCGAKNKGKSNASNIGRNFFVPVCVLN